MTSKFDDVEDLKKWLKKKSLHPASIDSCAKVLHDNFYNDEASFIRGFRDNELEDIGIPPAIVKQLENVFPRQPQSTSPQNKREAIVSTSATEREDKKQKFGA